MAHVEIGVNIFIKKKIDIEMAAVDEQCLIRDETDEQLHKRVERVQ